MSTPQLVILYDLSDPGAWEAARRHRALWGRLYVDVHSLGCDHIALVFRPAPDERWRPWERARLEWLFADRGGAA